MLITIACLTIALPEGTFWEIASFFILVAITIFTIVRHCKERRRRKAIRTQLGLFIQECRDLMARCENKNEPSLDKETKELKERIDSYLRSILGNSYISHMYSGAGLPIWIARLEQAIADFKD